MVMVGGLQLLTVVAGVSILCGAEVLDPPIFIMSFYLYCIVTHHIIVLCYCGLYSFMNLVFPVVLLC